MPRFHVQDQRGEGGGGLRRLEQSGTYDLMVVGWRRIEGSQTPGINIRSITVDTGEIVEEAYWLTERAFSRLAGLLDTLGWKGVIDTDDDAEMTQALERGIYRATVEATRPDKYWRHDTGFSHGPPQLQRSQATGHYDLPRAVVERWREAKEDFAAPRATGKAQRAATAYGRDDGGGIPF